MERIKSPHLGWSFTINHATLVPEGIEGFVKHGPTNRLGEVRMADNNGEYELHMQPGTGIIDWKKMFNLVEATGYEGHYMNAFGSLEDMLEGRNDILILDDKIIYKPTPVEIAKKRVSEA